MSYNHRKQYPDNRVPYYSVEDDGEHLFYCVHSPDGDAACSILTAKDNEIARLSDRIVELLTKIKILRTMFAMDNGLAVSGESMAKIQQRYLAVLDLDMKLIDLQSELSEAEISEETRAAIETELNQSPD